MQKEIKEGQICLKQRLDILLPGSAEALQKQYSAKSIAFLIIVAVAWDLLDQSAACSSQAINFSKLWIACVFGFLSIMQPKAYESTAQDSKASKGSQQNGYQHCRIRTWK